ncbi:hypothetical protein F5X97DRAFT_319127 [Nemania serpens]|nr:hypothetical protein F5X97DRAFT_319127 [Nemania serpens]
MEDLPMRPRGLRFQADFITPSHEAELLHIFRHELKWPEAPNPAARLSLHYGYTFDYKTFGVDPDIPFKPFPSWLRPLIPRVASRGRGRGRDGDENGEGDGNRDPDQVCLQHYPPGAGIPPHVDIHSAYDELYALSLGSAVVMQFRRTRGGDPDDKTEEARGGGEKCEEESNNINNSNNTAITATATSSADAADAHPNLARETVDVDLPPRSMMQMSGDARLHWEHGIRRRKRDALPGGAVRPRGDRWSITFRWLREGGECACGDVRLCDTAQRRAGVEKEFRWKQAAAGGEQGRDEEQENAGEEKEKEKGEGEREMEREREREKREGQINGGQQQEGEREVRGGESGDGCEPPDGLMQRTEETDHEHQHQHHQNDNILLSPP